MIKQILLFMLILLSVNIVSAQDCDDFVSYEVPENIDEVIDELFASKNMDIADYSGGDLTMEFYAYQTMGCTENKTKLISFGQYYNDILIIGGDTRFMFSPQNPYYGGMSCYGILAEPNDFKSEEYIDEKMRGTLDICGRYVDFSNVLKEPVISKREAKKIQRKSLCMNHDVMLAYWVKEKERDEPRLVWVFGKEQNHKRYASPLHKYLVVDAENGDILFRDDGIRYVRGSSDDISGTKCFFISIGNWFRGLFD